MCHMQMVRIQGMAENETLTDLIFLIVGHFSHCLLLPLDLLTIDHHTPTPGPVKYDKKDGQWYAHDGVDVKETQARKGMLLLILFSYYIVVEVENNMSSQ